MKLGQKSHRRIEDFFREHLEDDKFNLPEINFYAGKFSLLLAKILQIHGITIGNRVFLLPELIFREKSIHQIHLKDLIVHEITHVLQFQSEGFFKFIVKYYWNYWKILKTKKNWGRDSRLESYLENPFEVEARQTAAKFVEWSRRGKSD